jgi:hypothetical protein
MNLNHTIDKLFGGTMTKTQTSIWFSFFIILVVSIIISLCIQMYVTLPNVDNVVVEEDGDLIESPSPMTTESGEMTGLAKGSTTTLIIGSLLVAIGIILLLVKNDNMNTAGKSCIVIGSILEFISLSIVRQTRNLSPLQQSGYNITIGLIILQAVIGVWSNSNLSEHLNVPEYTVNIQKKDNIPMGTVQKE